MVDPISSSVSLSSATTPPASAPTGLTDKYLRYLDAISNLKENTAHLLEKTREVPSCSDLTHYELFSNQNAELQSLFNKTIAQIQEDCKQLNKLPSPTPAQSYYEKNFTETLETMHDALQEHTGALRELNRAIAAMKDKTDSKVTSSSPAKNQTRQLRIFSFQHFSAPATPKTPSTPVLVRQQALWDISPLPSPTSTPSQDSSSPPPLTHQTTDVFSTSPAPPPLTPSKSGTIQSLRRRDTDVTLLQDPVFLEQILRQGPATSSVSTPPPPSLSSRLWRATRSLFSFSKTKKDWARLPES